MGIDCVLMFMLASELVHKLEKLISCSQTIDGLWIAADSQEDLAILREALALIATHDPSRYAKMGRDLTGVWARIVPGSIGKFDYRHFICELDHRFVKTASAEQIASVIVHEATHARLWRRGIEYPEELRSRIEAVCIRRQQAFAARLPAPELTPDIIAEHYATLPVSSWSNTSLDRRHLAGSIAALRDLNVPRWIIRLALLRHRALRRRRRRAERSA